MAPPQDHLPDVLSIPVRYSSDLARSCASRTCFRLRPGKSRTPLRRPPPCSAHHRPWCPHRRCRAAAGSSPVRLSPSDFVGRLRLDVPVRYVIGPPWTHGPGPRWCVSVSTARVVHRANQSAPRVSLVSNHESTRSQSPTFCRLAPGFPSN